MVGLDVFCFGTRHAEASLLLTNGFRVDITKSIFTTLVSCLLVVVLAANDTQVGLGSGVLPLHSLFSCVGRLIVLMSTTVTPSIS